MPRSYIFQYFALRRVYSEKCNEVFTGDGWKMRIEMSKAEAITRIDRLLAYLEKIYTPQCDYDGALIRKDDITALVIARDALKEQRPKENRF